MTTVEDCFQFGQFDTIIMYFLFLLLQVNRGTTIILYRSFEDGSTLVDRVITDRLQFKRWVEPFINRM